jgi:Na+/H+-dicarboxylate symporter
MIQENEVIMLLLGIGCLAFIVTNRGKMEQIPESRTLVSSFYILIIGNVLTVLEGLLWNDFLNYLEHISYAVSSILLAVWCWKIFTRKTGAK